MKHNTAARVEFPHVRVKFTDGPILQKSSSATDTKTETPRIEEADFNEFLRFMLEEKGIRMRNISALSATG